ncbi:MAG TPA: DUF6090 family protein [Catalimonadaceae bacterium]|nr:DUF6090 family protein [Catalimonadaceae bacterium]HPI09497.1 DUF6090 family protein [Catalimonadaceae bacterium]
MLRIFRSVREQMLSGNQISRYLAYALGEIVLVVIGILIALSLDNWNKQQAENRQEAQSLANLCSDLDEQSVLLTEFIRIETAYSDHGVEVVQHFVRHKGFHQMDSVLPQLNSLASRRTFNPTNTTFKELISTGTIGLIRNDTVKRAIVRYYHNLERVNLIVNNNNARLVDALFNPVLFDQTRFVSDIDDPEMNELSNRILDSASLQFLKAASDNQLSDPANSLHLMNALQERINVANGHINLYNTLQAETRALHQKLKKELEKSGE